MALSSPPCEPELVSSSGGRSTWWRAVDIAVRLPPKARRATASRRLGTGRSRRMATSACANFCRDQPTRLQTRLPRENRKGPLSPRRARPCSRRCRAPLSFRTCGGGMATRSLGCHRQPFNSCRLQPPLVSSNSKIMHGRPASASPRRVSLSTASWQQRGFGLAPGMLPLRVSLETSQPAADALALGARLSWPCLRAAAQVVVVRSCRSHSSRSHADELVRHARHRG